MAKMQTDKFFVDTVYFISFEGFIKHNLSNIVRPV